jgi:post-segregation antitoxin (ccd killing protein)
VVLDSPSLLEYDHIHTHIQGVRVSFERVTVTIPSDLLRDVDRLERNRSRFIQDAVRHEVERRRTEELARSLRNPHPESTLLAAEGMAEWAARMPGEDAEGLVRADAGRRVHWVEGQGWIGDEG